MRIAECATVRFEDFPNLTFVEITTDGGLVGLGETMFGADAVEAWVHDVAAPKLLGRDARDIERIAGELTGYVGYASSGAETRGRSAVDVALWDLLGQATEQPLFRLLGGRTRDAVSVYNTCAGSEYVRRTSDQAMANWGVGDGDRATGPYEDLHGFLHHADRLAEDLLAGGIAAMKIWPFDPAAERSGGREIGAAALRDALEPLRKVRAAVGDEMDILVELHALWDPAPAWRILEALEPLAPRWVEDPIRLDAPEQAAALQARTSLPIAGGETLAGVAAFKALLDRGALSVAIVDLGWCGGLTTARRVAALAEAAGVSVAAHDCTGPVGLAAATHFTIATPNAFVQEIVRAFYHGWYGELVTELPALERGEIRPLEGPGLGLALRPEARERGRRLATAAQTSTTTGSTIGRRRSRA